MFNVSMKHITTNTQPMPLSPDCDTRVEPPRHDHRPLPHLPPDSHGRAGDERGPRHILTLLSLRRMQ